MTNDVNESRSRAGLPLCETQQKDVERRIALSTSVLSYIRQAWGNDAPPVSPRQIH